MEEARKHFKASPTELTQKSLANASKTLADLYTEKQTLHYAEIAKVVESTAEEGKTKAAFQAINKLTGRKSRTPCGKEAESPEDRVKTLQYHLKIFCLPQRRQ